MGRLWFTLEGVGEIGLVVGIGGPGQRSAGLVVRDVALAGVREQRKNGGDLSGRSSLAGGDGDEELDQVVIDTPSARLKNVDILAPDGLVDLDSSLADGKLGQEDITDGDLEVVANCCVELRMGASSQYDDVADHDSKQSSFPASVSVTVPGRLGG